MLSLGEAIAMIVPCCEPLGVERAPLLTALARVLAEDVLAEADLPAFDNSAMDGYALRRADLERGQSLALDGESRAGGPWPAALPPATAMRVFTGAPLPEGADTVVIQEHVSASADAVLIERSPAQGANVRARGSDLRRGELALERGTRIGSGEIGLLAALGRHTVSVQRRPRVAIVSAGDELREIGAAGAPGTIVGSNAYALAAQLLEHGAEPWVLPSMPDHVPTLVRALEHALRADAVITTGGASVGEYDLMAEAFAGAGIAIQLHRVAIKPGKPIMFGLAGRVPVLGLPGNPVSAMVGFQLFVRPVLRRMSGDATPHPVLIEVELEHDHRHAVGRLEFARAQLACGSDGRWLAQLHMRQGSGSLRSMCGVDALVLLPGDVEQFARGTRLQAVHIGRERGQRETPFV